MWWAPGWAALEKESVHVERKNAEAGVKVLVHAAASVGAQVLCHQELPMCLAARHVRPHGDVEDVTACSVGQVELLLVAQGVSLVPEKVQKVGETGVVLLKKKRYRKVISVTSGGKGEKQLSFYAKFINII